MKRICAMLCAAMAAVSFGVSAAPFAAAVKENGKWGVLGADGALTVPAAYDAAAVSLSEAPLRASDLASMEGRENFIEVRADGRRGFFSRAGAEIVPVSYTERSCWSEGALAVRAEGRVSFYTADGRALASGYEEAGDFQNGFAPVKRDGRWGYLSLSGEVIAPAWREARDFSCGAAPVKDKKWGAIDETGALVVPCVYDDVGPAFSEGLLAVKKGNRWGYVNTAGEEIAAPSYRAVSPVFSEGLAAVQNEEKLWGFINTKGETVIAPAFKAVLTPFSEGLAGVATRDGNAYIRTDGTVAFLADFDQLFPFENGLAEYREGFPVAQRSRSAVSIGWGVGWGWGHHHRHHPWGWGIGWPVWGWDDWTAPAISMQERRGYLDRTGRLIAPATLSRVYPATDRGILVFNEGRFGWLGRDGLYRIHAEYRALAPVPGTPLFVARDEAKHWGLLDDAGSAVTDFAYDGLEPLGGGFFAYKKSGRWGLLGEDGTELCPALYEEIRARGDGLFPAREKNTWLYLGEDGKPAISFETPAEDALPFTEGRAGVKQKGRWGLIDTAGHWIVAPRFEAYAAL